MRDLVQYCVLVFGLQACKFCENDGKCRSFTQVDKGQNEGKSYYKQNCRKIFSGISRNLKLLETQLLMYTASPQNALRYLDALIQEGVPYFKQYACRQTLNEQHQKPFNSDE